MKTKLIAFAALGLGVLAAVGIFYGLRGLPEGENMIAQSFAPFEKAVADYCQRKSFGMKLLRINEITVSDDGNSATAACKMQEAEGTYNLAITWTFTFKRNENGEWTATKHEAG